MVAWQIAMRAAWLGIACLEARSVVGGRFAGLCAWLLTSFRRQPESCDWLWRWIPLYSANNLGCQKLWRRCDVSSDIRVFSRVSNNRPFA